MHHFHPPVYFLLTTSIGLSLRWLPIEFASFPHWVRIFAIIPACIGALLGIVSVYYFLRSKTGIIPFSPTTYLVTNGFYRYTRNPMYLGLICIQISILSAFSNLLALVVVPVFWWILHTRFVIKEEKLLLEKFGVEYEQLIRHTRRWL